MAFDAQFQPGHLPLDDLDPPESPPAKPYAVPLVILSGPTRLAEPEFGWDEVGKGLACLLFGQVLCLVIVLLALGVLWQAGLRGGKTHPLGLSTEYKEVLFFCSLPILGLLGLVSYALVLKGLWRCQLSVPERFGARWLVFACIACVAIGPLLEGLGAVQILVPNYVKFTKGFPALERVQPPPGSLTALGAGLGFLTLGGLFFLAFLRMAARCLEAHGLRLGVELFLLLLCALVTLSVAMALHEPWQRHHPAQLHALSAAWPASAVFYFMLVARIIRRFGDEHQRRRTSLSRP